MNPVDLDDAVEAGMMLEFVDPRNGDTYLIPTARLAIEMGYTHGEAREYHRERYRECIAAGLELVAEK